MYSNNKKKRTQPINVDNQMIGLLLFIIFFIIVIPYIIYKKLGIEKIEGYFPTIPTIATVISYHFLPNYFSSLYRDDTKSKYENISKKLINVTTISSITILILYLSYKTNSFIEGGARALILFTLFFILPNDFVNNNMIKLNNYIETKNEYVKNTLIYTFMVSNILLLIACEDRLISYFSNILVRKIKNLN
jgi:hypothetical protein